MPSQNRVRYPNESAAYRAARDALLAAELELDAKVREVAEKRRALPPGGELKEDYVFEGREGPVRLSELFRPGRPTVFLYSFMYGPQMREACPSCTSLADGFAGIARHLDDRIGFAVVAKSPVDRLAALAESRGWSGDLMILSSHGTSYNADYGAETATGGQLPAANVFHRSEDGVIRHFWGAELLYHERPGHPRHVDTIWPIWNVLDMTPEGRGADWEPRLSYE